MSAKRQTVLFYAIMLSATFLAIYTWSFEVRLAVAHPIAAAQTFLIRVIPGETQEQYENRMDKLEGAQR